MPPMKVGGIYSFVKLWFIGDERQFMATPIHDALASIHLCMCVQIVVLRYDEIGVLYGTMPTSSRVNSYTQNPAPYDEGAVTEGD